MMTASQIVSLKAEVKAEMQRRHYTGSVASYGGASYDFTVTPAAGQPILTEHGNKIIQPLLAVKAISGLAAAVQGNPIPAAFDYSGLHTVVTNLAAEAIYGSGSSCDASCTGLCEGGCANTCVGCTGSCTGTCYGTCWANCANDCSYTCSNTCSGGCTASCSDNCAGGCTNGCTGGCEGTCDVTCQGVGAF